MKTLMGDVTKNHSRGAVIAAVANEERGSEEEELGGAIGLLRRRLGEDYRGMFRAAGGALRHPFLTPGSEQYADVL
ncbi:MAG TPA: hypothetical protein VGD81_17050, partial [Opitutaceae bacterium]